MPHLLRDWSRVSQRFRTAEQVLLLFDYDGTLTPIVSRPELAVLAPEVRQLLEELSRRSKYVVGIISGRGLADVRDKVGLPEIIYAGNHGLEIQGPGVQFLHPAASQLRPVLGQLCRDLSHRLSSYSGVIVEDKGLTLSVHYRMTPRRLVEQVGATFEDAVSSLLELAQVKVTYGKKVLEVRPNVEWDKGRAISQLLEAQPQASLVSFFGDDVTDEDGFAVVQDAGGIAVYVGPDAGPTRARYQLESPEQVAEALRLVAHL